MPVGKVVCVGRNYLEHIQELRNTVPDTPVVIHETRYGASELGCSAKFTFNESEAAAITNWN
ncbi:MAG: hypothetical protein R3F37_03985 [Candidatus Competibacteraceae bacterium]